MSAQIHLKNKFLSREDYNKSIRKSHSERLEHLIESGSFSDVSFRVGLKEEVIKGHRILLIAGSPVFQAILTGKNYDEGRGILIPDVEPPEFKLLLKYLYTGQYPKTSDILPLFRAAKYFMAEDLVEFCVEELSGNLCIENALLIYEQAVKYNEDDLAKSAENFIFRNGNKILEQMDFLAISLESVSNFITSDKFRANDEVQLALAVHKWGNAECIRQNLEPTQENIREILNPIIHLIRFPQMTPAEFSTKIAPLGILTGEEMISILLYLTIPPSSRGSMHPEKFNTIPRNYMTPTSMDEFHTLKRSERISRGVFISPIAENIWKQMSFQTSKDILLISLGLFFHNYSDFSNKKCPCQNWTCSISCCEIEEYSINTVYLVDIEIVTKMGQLLGSKTLALKGSKRVQHVQFSQKIPIKSYEEYVVSMKYSIDRRNQAKSYYGLGTTNLTSLIYNESDYKVKISKEDDVKFLFWDYEMRQPGIMSCINEIHFKLA